MSTTKHKTREGWLNAAALKLRPVFKKAEAELPEKVMMGCGWPKGGKAEVIGQCFGKTWTQDGTVHIFISPTQADSVKVLATLAHELVHASLGEEKGHGKEFKKLARAIGLEGKLTATTVSEASPLHSILVKIVEQIGEYPHSAMKPGGGKGSEGEGGGGWKRLYSPILKGYSVVISPKSLEEYGYPMDAVGNKMIVDKPAF